MKPDVFVKNCAKKTPFGTVGCKLKHISPLLDAVIEAAPQGVFHDLLLKANRDAQGYISAKGLQELSVKDAGRDYPYRFWRDLPGD